MSYIKAKCNFWENKNATEGSAATVIVYLPQATAKNYFYHFKKKITGKGGKCS